MAKFFDTHGAVAYLREEHRVARTEPTLRRYRVQGLGPQFSKMGNSVIYSSDEIDEWVAARKTPCVDRSIRPTASGADREQTCLCRRAKPTSFAKKRERSSAPPSTHKKSPRRPQ